MTAYGARSASLNRQPIERTIASGQTTLNVASNRMKYLLTAGGTRDIATIRCTGVKDGFVLFLRIKTGSSNITLVETGNIVVNSTSLVLGAQDSVMLEYSKADGKWIAIGNYNV